MIHQEGSLWARPGVKALLALMALGSGCAGEGDGQTETPGDTDATASLPATEGLSWDTAATGFVNFETPHVHPLDITPDGTRLLAVNLPDASLEVFDLSGGGLRLLKSIPVGMDPVSVRAFGDSTAWVINHVSDSISIVDLSAGSVVHTLLTGDEPADVVFAGAPERAWVSLSQLNEVWSFDPAALQTPPQVLKIEGEDPRALAVDASGRYVLAAIFEAGNDTTIINQERVSLPSGPYGGQNPPPNSGEGFEPQPSADLAAAPPTGHIVRKDDDGRWVDDNQHDWTDRIPWDIHGHDVAIIDTTTRKITYASRLMNANMALAPRADGLISVVGTDAINQIRFEPNVNGIFTQVVMATFDPAHPERVETVDLNPHLDYTTARVPQAQRDRSLGDPRAIVWLGQTGFVAGMGSGNVVVIDASGARLAEIEVGLGPTGLVADGAGERLFALNKLSAEVIEIDPAARAVKARATFFDPTPEVIRAGRPLLYDTHKTSGLGQASCGSCHIDGRTDQLAWDLGDPRGQVRDLDQTCFGPALCPPWHPMKGPLVTQTLQGIIGTEPLHWRGDKQGFSDFAGAFASVLGADAPASPQDMATFEAFVKTMVFPPNPFRGLDNSLPTQAPNGGDAVRGLDLYFNEPIKRDYTASKFKCIDCHSADTGSNSQLVMFSSTPVSQSFKTPQLRNLYERSGFDMERTDNNRGFGYFFDGEVDTLYQTLDMPALQFPPGQQGVQDRLDLEALLLAFSADPPAGVGAMVGVGPDNRLDGATLDRVSQFRAVASTGEVGLVAHSYGQTPRGYALQADGLLQSDSARERITVEALLEQAADHHVTFMLVASGTQTRVGIDRDGDGVLNADERP